MCGSGFWTRRVGRECRWRGGQAEARSCAELPAWAVCVPVLKTHPHVLHWGVDSEGVPCCWPCAQVSLKFTKYWWVWADEFQASALVWVPGNTHLPLHPQLSTSQALEPEYSAPVALGKSSLFLCLSFFICEMGQ